MSDIHHAASISNNFVGGFDPAHAAAGPSNHAHAGPSSPAHAAGVPANPAIPPTAPIPRALPSPTAFCPLHPGLPAGIGGLSHRALPPPVRPRKYDIYMVPRGLPIPRQHPEPGTFPPAPPAAKLPPFAAFFQPPPPVPTFWTGTLPAPRPSHPLTSPYPQFPGLLPPGPRVVMGPAPPHPPSPPLPPYPSLPPAAHTSPQFDRLADSIDDHLWEMLGASWSTLGPLFPTLHPDEQAIAVLAVHLGADDSGEPTTFDVRCGCRRCNSFRRAMWWREGVARASAAEEVAAEEVRGMGLHGG